MPQPFRRLEDALVKHSSGLLSRPPAQLGLLVLLCLALFVPGQAAIPVVDRDEARFAQASRQMVETGDFIDIRLHEDARHKKPVGIYWLQALAVKLSGTGPQAPIWVHRLPSLIGAIAVVLLTCWAMLPILGPAGASLAAILLASTVLLGVEARLAKTDAMLAATIVAAQGAMLRAALGTVKPMAWIAVVFWLAIGAGILIKGPIILLVVGLTAVAFALIRRKWRWFLALRPWPMGLLAILVALPWYVAIGWRTDGAFFAESVGRDLLGKVAEGQESHGAPPGTYLALFWYTAWPMAVFVVIGLHRLWALRRDPAVQFLLAWAIPSWLVFEMVATKLPHYVLPVYPALAALAAIAVLDALRVGSSDAPPALIDETRLVWWRKLLMVLAGSGGVCIVIAGVGIAYWLGGTVNGVLSWIAAFLAVALSGAACLAALRGFRRAFLLLLLASAPAAYGFLYQGVFPGLEPVWVSHRAGAVVAEGTADCRDATIASVGFREASIIFETKTAIAFPGPDDAAAMVRNPALPCTAAIVAAPYRSAFLAAVSPGIALEEKTVSGLNIGNGDTVTLHVFIRRGALAEGTAGG